MSLADYLQNLSPLGKREVLQVARKQTRASLERSKERSTESSSHRDHDHKMNLVVSTATAAAGNRPQSAVRDEPKEHAAAVRTSEGMGVGWQHAEGMRAAARLASVTTMEKRHSLSRSRGGEADETRLPQQDSGNAHLDPLAETLVPSDLRTLGRSGGIVLNSNKMSEPKSTATLRNPYPYAREGKENEEQPPRNDGTRSLGSKNAFNSSSLPFAATTSSSHRTTNDCIDNEGLLVSSSLSTSLERATQILSARPRNEALAPMLAARLFNHSNRSNARNEQRQSIGGLLYAEEGSSRSSNGVSSGGRNDYADLSSNIEKVGNGRAERSSSITSAHHEAAAAYRSIRIMTPMGTISTGTATTTARISSLPHGGGEAQGHDQYTLSSASYNFAPPAAECSPLPLPHRPDIHVMSIDEMYEQRHDTTASGLQRRQTRQLDEAHTTSEIRAEPLPFSSPLPTTTFPQKCEGPTHHVVVDDDQLTHGPTSNFQQRRYSSSSIYSSIAVPHLSSMVPVTKREGTFLSTPSLPTTPPPTTDTKLRDTGDRLVAPSFSSGFLSPPPHDEKKRAAAGAAGAVSTSSTRDSYYYYHHDNENNNHSNGSSGIGGEASGKDTVSTVGSSKGEEGKVNRVLKDDGDASVHRIAEHVSSSSYSLGEHRTFSNCDEDGENEDGEKTDADARTAIFSLESGRAQRSISPATLRLREQASVATATNAARAKRIASITDEFLGVSPSRLPFSSRSTSKSSLVPPPEGRESQRESEPTAGGGKRTVIASGLAPYLLSRSSSPSSSTVHRGGCGDGRTYNPLNDEDPSECWTSEGDDAAGETSCSETTVDYYGIHNGDDDDDDIEDEDNNGDGAHHHIASCGSEPKFTLARRAEKEKEKEEVLSNLRAISDSILSQLSPTTRALYPEEKHVIVCAVEAVIEFAEHGVDGGGQWCGVSSAPLKSKRNPLVSSSTASSSASGMPEAATGSNIANLVSQPVSSNTIGSRSSKAMWRLFIDWCERSRGSIVRAVGSKSEAGGTEGGGGGGIRVGGSRSSAAARSTTGEGVVLPSYRSSSGCGRVTNTSDSSHYDSESVRVAAADDTTIKSSSATIGRGLGGASSVPTPHRYLLSVPSVSTIAKHKSRNSSTSLSLMSSRGGRTRTPPPSSFPHSTSVAATQQLQRQQLLHRCRKDDKRWFVKGIAPLSLYDLRGVRRVATPQPSLAHLYTPSATSAATGSGELAPTATKRRVVARALPCPASAASALFCTSLRLTLSHLHQVSIALSSRFDEWNALTPGTLEFFVVFLCLDFLVNGYRHNWKPKAVLMRADPSSTDDCSLLSSSSSLRRSSEPTKVLTISRRKMAEVLDVLFDVSDGVRD